MLLRYVRLICIALLLVTAFDSCREDEEFTDSTSATLRFSDDTLFFDTVFSKMGSTIPLSVTKQLWVKNTNSKGVRVNIRIKGTSNGSLRLNIDGQPAVAVTGKEILGNDSIVVFVQFYSNAGNNFIITDQILFETNGNTQDVDVVGFGRDAHYYRNQVIEGPGGFTEWTADKPHVIYDSILVPLGQTLRIQAGTRVHSHTKSVILVQGTLIVDGDLNNPVVFEGDRTDAEYRDRAGQWIGIRILPRSKDNIITHALIKNGIIGIEVDSAPVNTNPNLVLRESVIDNMLAVGVVGYSAQIIAINNTISNCAQFTFYGALGGDYTLYHNTFTDYANNSNRQNSHFLLENSPYTNEQNQIVIAFPLNYRVINNIIYGSREEELLLVNNPDGNQTYSHRIIQNNVLKTEISSLSTSGNILNQDPQFENTTENNYKLKATSPAKSKGIFIGVTTDLGGNPRSSTAPTAGAWE